VPDRCPPFCPACVLRDHLEIRGRSGAGPEDAVFVGARGDRFGENGGRHAVRRLHDLVADLDDAEDGTHRVIGTRTLRVTGVTLAYEAGMSVGEIADKLTAHRSKNMPTRYLRHGKADAADHVLPIAAHDEGEASR
jgi:integrase